MDGMIAVFAAVFAFLITAVLGIAVIPLLKRLKFGQSIKEIGPVWHKKKQGTPTMGGVLFIAGIAGSMALVAVILAIMPAGNKNGAREIAGVAGGAFIALAFGFIGFMDDYIKVVKKRNLGLTAKQKFLLQLIVGSVFLFIEYISGKQGTTFTVPFFNGQLDFGLLYWPAALILIVGMVNAVNLTDGIDGLCGSVTFIVAVCLMICSKLVGLNGYAALSAALAGSCLGFLVWNLHPAKVFMGDTGSLFLGGLICAVSFGINYPLLLLPMGIIYILECLSVIIQVISFKTTGKRVFKMSPIHHHFELCGWSEVKIVTVFSSITAVFSISAVIWLADYVGQISVGEFLAGLFH